MRTACIIAALLAAPSAASAGAPQWGINSTTVVRGGATLPDHLLIVVSAWCTYVDEPAVWREVDEFYGEPDEAPTVGNNLHGCTYNLVEDGEVLAGGPWDAPRAHDDIFYALPRASFPVVKDTIPALDRIPLAEFYPRLESGKDGVLRAKLGPSRGLRVPDGSPLVSFQDTLRAELEAGVFTLRPEQRTWKLRDGREAVEPLGDVPPSEPPIPKASPIPIPVPEASPIQTHVPKDSPSQPPRPVPKASPNPAPIPVPEVTPAPPAATPTVTRPPLARDLVIGGGCLALGLSAGFAFRRRR
jgi:hypothetical protein